MNIRNVSQSQNIINQNEQKKSTIAVSYNNNNTTFNLYCFLICFHTYYLITV